MPLQSVLFSPGKRSYCCLGSPGSGSSPACSFFESAILRAKPKVVPHPRSSAPAGLSGEVSAYPKIPGGEWQQSQTAKTAKDCLRFAGLVLYDAAATCVIMNAGGGWLGTLRTRGKTDWCV